MASEIRNLGLMQPVDFTGFRGQLVRSIIPTDIDAFVDFGGNLFVFVEYKYRHRKKQQEEAQRRALERLCQTLDRGGARAFVLLAEHEHPAGELISGHDADVASVYGMRAVDRRYRWEPGGGRTVLEWFQMLYAKFDSSDVEGF